MCATRCHTATCADISPPAQTYGQGRNSRTGHATPAAGGHNEGRTHANGIRPCNTLWLSALQKAVF